MTNAVQQVDVTPRDAQWYADRINFAWQKAVPSIIEAGKWLVEAKDSLPHGQWERMFKNHKNKVAGPIPFSLRTAQTLMAIIRHPCLPKARYVALLPPNWPVLGEIARLDKNEFNLGLERKVIHPECTRKQIRKYIRDLRPQEIPSEDFGKPPEIACADCGEWLWSSVDECDLLLTDPPYSTDIDDIIAFAKSWVPDAMSKVKPTGRAYVFVGAYPKELAAYTSVFEWTQILVWTYRNTLGPSPSHNYKLNWQAILYWCGPDAPKLDCNEMLEQFSVFDVAAPDARHNNRFYEWQKPDTLGDRIVRHSTVKGELVIDPFAGSGSFLLSAARHGRLARGCDVSREQVDLAIERGCTLAN